MGTVLRFNAGDRERLADEPRQAGECEIVIFPGVRIERRDDKPGPHAGRPSSGRGKLDGTNARRRPRKTS